MSPEPPPDDNSWLQMEDVTDGVGFGAAGIWCFTLLAIGVWILVYLVFGR